MSGCMPKTLGGSVASFTTFVTLETTLEITTIVEDRYVFFDELIEDSDEKNKMWKLYSQSGTYKQLTTEPFFKPSFNENKQNEQVTNSASIEYKRQIKICYSNGECETYYCPEWFSKDLDDGKVPTDSISLNDLNQIIYPVKPPPPPTKPANTTAIINDLGYLPTEASMLAYNEAKKRHAETIAYWKSLDGTTSEPPIENNEIKPNISQDHILKIFIPKSFPIAIGVPASYQLSFEKGDGKYTDSLVKGNKYIWDFIVFNKSTGDLITVINPNPKHESTLPSSSYPSDKYEIRPNNYIIVIDIIGTLQEPTITANSELYDSAQIYYSRPTKFQYYYIGYEATPTDDTSRQNAQPITVNTYEIRSGPTTENLTMIVTTKEKSGKNWLGQPLTGPWDTMTAEVFSLPEKAVGGPIYEDSRNMRLTESSIGNTLVNPSSYFANFEANIGSWDVREIKKSVPGLHYVVTTRQTSIISETTCTEKSDSGSGCICSNTI